MKKHVVKLNKKEKEYLLKLLFSNEPSTSKLCYANILLESDKGLKDKPIADRLKISISSVSRIRKQFIKGGLDMVLNRKKSLDIQHKKNKPITERYKYIVKLTSDEREHLLKLISTGKSLASKLCHARILLKADKGLEDEIIADALEISSRTVSRTRKRFIEEGFDEALNCKKPKSTRQRKLDGKQEAQLIAIACSIPPEGFTRWSLRLLADKLVELEYVDNISHETVRQVLKKTNLNLILGNNG